ncbi:MAG: redoxin family protein [Phycisphaerales bacterium]
MTHPPLRLMPNVLRICGVLLVLAVVAPAAWAQPRREIPADWFYDGANRPKPLKDLEGKSAAAISPDTWIGDPTTIEGSIGKVVILDFWATWCGPCMASIPKNVQLVSDYKDKGLVFIGIHDSNSGWETADQVVKQKSINYPVVKDKGGETTKAYNLQFWPTYVAIDKFGIVRAAGLLPDRVHDVVEILLAEPGPVGMGGASASGNPPSWYYAGAARPAWLGSVEEKSLPSIGGEGTKWSGGVEAPKPDDFKGKVLVMHFMSNDSAVAMSQLAELNKLAPEMGPQGVVFVGVCDSRATWDGPTGAAAALKTASPKVPILQDAAIESKTDEAVGDKAEAPKPAEAAKGPPVIKSGRLAADLGVRLAPTIVVVDRAGKIRAAGVKVEKVKDIISKLLAEPMPDAPASPAKPQDKP